MNKITRRLCLLAVPLALAGLTASPVLAQQLSLGQVSTYLNSFTSAEGEFTQINADGTISTGTVYIKRPNRVRFEYNPPEESLVVAGGGQVAIFDPRSDDGPDRYPLNQTPLSIILERNIDLTRTDMVTGHTSDGTTTTVTTGACLTSCSTFSAKCAIGETNTPTQCDKCKQRAPTGTRCLFLR